MNMKLYVVHVIYENYITQNENCPINLLKTRSVEWDEQRKS